MVLPVPKPPGTAAVPPFAIGKRVSRIRCPVTSGTLAGKRWWVGLGIRIGHFCASARSLVVPSANWIVTMGSRIVYSPSAAAWITVASVRLGGTMDLCRMESVSWVSAIMDPGPTISPSFTVICVFHFFCVSRESTLTPREIYLPEALAISSRGRWIPSKMLWMIPGPRSTEMASPVPVTVSPGFSPVVSSKTCTVVMPFFRPMISPTRFSGPT